MTRVFYPREPQDEANDRELRDYTNKLLDAEAREAEWLTGSHPCTTYRPDETDDQWATDWQNDFEQSARDWERQG